MKAQPLFFVLLLFSVSIFSQVKKEKAHIKEATQIKKDTLFTDDLLDPLSPAKAAFYSAVLPGLGQAYNKKYWKIPLVYGAIGTSSYFYFNNNSNFKTYRNAYKLRLAGKPDEFVGLISTDGLINAQKVFKQNRDLSLFLTLAFYALNILEANVDAHILDKSIDNKVSFKPLINFTPDLNKPVFGLSTSITIK